MQVDVATTPLSYRIGISPAGNLKGTNINIREFVSPFNEFKFDVRSRRWVLDRQYRYYNKKKETLHLPRYDLPRFLDWVKEQGCTPNVIEIPLVKGRSVEIPLDPAYSDRNELQTKAIQYLSDQEGSPLRGLAIQTGCISGSMSIRIMSLGVEFVTTLREFSDRMQNPEDIRTQGIDPDDVYIRSLNTDTGRFFWNKIISITNSGILPVTRVELSNGRQLICTEEHLLRAESSYVETGKSYGQRLAFIEGYEEGTEIVSYDDVEYVEAVGIDDLCFDLEVSHPYPNFVVGDFVVHNSGKTYSTIKTLSLLGVRSMICVPSMVEQWRKAIETFTLLRGDDIYVITGAASISKLLLGIDRKLNPKIILCSSATLQNYCDDKDSYANYPSFDEFCQRLDIGVRITDEAHWRFHANLMLDLRLTPAITVALTATFDNSREDAKRIFDAHYPPSIRYGEGVYKKYSTIYDYHFTSGYGDIPLHAYSGREGYSHASLEKWLLRNEIKLLQIWDDVWKPALYEHYVSVREKETDKLLVLATCVSMCKWLVKRIRKMCPDRKVAIYISETDDSVLTDADIIVSTPKSAGTGRDIPGLITLLNTVATASVVELKQTLGRLRELKDGRSPRYLTWCLRSIAKHIKYAMKRDTVLRPLVIAYYRVELN